MSSWPVGGAGYLRGTGLASWVRLTSGDDQWWSLETARVSPRSELGERGRLLGMCVGLPVAVEVEEEEEGESRSVTGRRWKDMRGGWI